MSQASRSSKKRRRDPRQAILAIGAILFAAIFALSGLQAFTPTDTLATITPTFDPLAQPFPTVPPEGTAVTQTGVYFHPSGLFSLPQIEGWDRPSNDPEETLVAAAGVSTSRAGVTFINGTAQSVIHAYAESDTLRSLVTADDLSAYYTPELLTEAWAQYTGGWRETGRHVDGDALVIDFELSFSDQTYLGRQISRLDGEWLKVLRLVAPNNNPGLLDRLSATLAPNFRLWRSSLAAPLDWKTIADSGYMIRYPSDWTQASGGVGRPFSVSGPVDGVRYRLTTRAEESAPLQVEDQVRTWLESAAPRAQVQMLLPFSQGEATGYQVSYQDVDADGNRRTSLALLLNGLDDTLFVAILQSEEGGTDLLAGELPATLAAIRSTFTTTATTGTAE
jgi:hypothetical protein